MPQLNLEAHLGPLSLQVNNGRIALDVAFVAQFDAPTSKNITYHLGIEGTGFAGFHIFDASHYDMAFNITNFENFLLHPSAKGSVIVTAPGAQLVREIKSIEQSPFKLLLLNPAVLVNALDKMLELLDEGITAGESDALSLPVIGDAVATLLSGPDTFINAFRSTVIDRLRAFLGNSGQSGAEAIAAELEIIFKHELGILKSPHVEVVFLNAGGNKTYSQSDCLAGPDAFVCEAVEWRFSLGQDVVPEFNVGFDLGLPGFPLSLDVEGDIRLDLFWELNIGFGYRFARRMLLN